MLEAPKIDWQPIGTAPKDGTRVLVREGARVYIASWIAPYEEVGKECWAPDGAEDWAIREYPGSPDGWAPLPRA